MIMEKIVHRALSNALKNGYTSHLTDKPLNVAVDLTQYEPDLEGKDPSKLVSHVKSWQLKNVHAVAKARAKPGRSFASVFTPSELFDSESSSLHSDKYAVYRHNGYEGNRNDSDHPQHGTHMKTHNSEQDARGHADFLNRRLLPSEKRHLGIRYHVVRVPDENAVVSAYQNAKEPAKGVVDKKHFSSDSFDASAPSADYKILWSGSDEKRAARMANNLVKQGIRARSARWSGNGKHAVSVHQDDLRKVSALNGRFSSDSFDASSSKVTKGHVLTHLKTTPTAMHKQLSAEKQLRVVHEAPAARMDFKRPIEKQRDFTAPYSAKELFDGDGFPQKKDPYAKWTPHHHAGQSLMMSVAPDFENAIHAGGEKITKAGTELVAGPRKPSGGDVA